MHSILKTTNNKSARAVTCICYFMKYMLVQCHYDCEIYAGTMSLYVIMIVKYMLVQCHYDCDIYAGTMSL